MWIPVSEVADGRLAQYCRLESLSGPQDHWRASEDRSAALGRFVSAELRENVPEGSVMVDNWFGGIQLLCGEVPPLVVSSEYPSAQEDRDRLASSGEIRGYCEGRTPRISAFVCHI